MCKLQTPTDQAGITLEHRNELWVTLKDCFVEHLFSEPTRKATLDLIWCSTQDWPKIFAGAHQNKGQEVLTLDIPLHSSSAWGWKGQEENESFKGSWGLLAFPQCKQRDSSCWCLRQGWKMSCRELNHLHSGVWWRVCQDPPPHPNGEQAKDCQLQQHHVQPGRMWGAVNDLYGS